MKESLPKARTCESKIQRAKVDDVDSFLIHFLVAIEKTMMMMR